MASYFLSSNWPKQVRILEQNIDIQKVIEKFSFLLTEQRLKKIERVVSQRSNSLIPVLENIYDRGNISAVMRSAEAFGFYDFHIIYSVAPFKESARVTQGADKWLNVKKGNQTETALQNF